MTVQEILDLLKQQQSAGAGGGGGSVGTASLSPQLLKALTAIINGQSGGSSSPTSSSVQQPVGSIGSGLSGGLSSLGTSAALGATAGDVGIGATGIYDLVQGAQTGNTTELGGGSGALAGLGGGAALGTLVFPGVGTAAGALIGGLVGLLGGSGIGEAFSGGIPATGPSSKSGALGTALEGGSDIQSLLGQYVTGGVNAGGKLSESGSSTLEGGADAMANILQALSGQSIGASGGKLSLGNLGFGNAPTLSGVQGLGGASGELQLPQGDQFVSGAGNLQTAANDASKLIGYNFDPSQLQEVWKKLLSQLQSQGVLQKYQGTLGVAGPGAGIGNINSQLARPLGNNPGATAGPSPYLQAA